MLLGTFTLEKPQVNKQKTILKFWPKRAVTALSGSHPKETLQRGISAHTPARDSPEQARRVGATGGGEALPSPGLGGKNQAGLYFRRGKRVSPLPFLYEVAADSSAPRRGIGTSRPVTQELFCRNSGDCKISSLPLPHRRSCP